MKFDRYISINTSADPEPLIQYLTEMCVLMDKWKDKGLLSSWHIGINEYRQLNIYSEFAASVSDKPLTRDMVAEIEAKIAQERYQAKVRGES